jgi:hypothetical protein
MTAVSERPGAVARTVLRWVREEAGFAQVVTVNGEGFPVTRTLGAFLTDDWSVDLVQRRIHRRLGQLRRNPRLEVVWVGTPAPGSRNDHPAVFDFGRLVPRTVMVRGVAEFMDEEWTLRRYREETARLAERGGSKAPDRDDDNVRAELVGVHVVPVRVRAEGFGDGAQSFTWSIQELR